MIVKLFLAYFFKKCVIFSFKHCKIKQWGIGLFYVTRNRIQEILPPKQRGF